MKRAKSLSRAVAILGCSLVLSGCPSFLNSMLDLLGMKDEPDDATLSVELSGPATVAPGAAATFHALVSHATDTSGLSYQWFLDGAPVSGQIDLASWTFASLEAGPHTAGVTVTEGSEAAYDYADFAVLSGNSPAVSITNLSGDDLASVTLTNTNSYTFYSSINDAFAPSATQYFWYVDGNLEYSTIHPYYSFYFYREGGGTYAVRLRVSDGVSEAEDQASITLNIPPAAPTISLDREADDGYSYWNPVEVTLVPAASGQTLRYTLDGSMPTTASNEYSAPIFVQPAAGDDSVILTAMAWDGAGLASDPASSYLGFLLAPVVAAPEGGSYSAEQDVSLACATNGALIYYTLDGSEPTEASEPYAGTPIRIDRTRILKTIAYAGLVQGGSAVGIESYSLKVATPTISPAAGTYDDGIELTLATDTAGAEIRWKLGSAPTSATGALYDPANKPYLSSDGVVFAAAFREGWTNSDATSAAYVITATGIGVEFLQRLVPGDLYAEVAFESLTDRWLALTIAAGDGGRYYMGWSELEEGDGRGTINVLVSLFAADGATIVGGLSAADRGYWSPWPVDLDPGEYLVKVTPESGSVAPGSAWLKVAR